LISVNTKNVIYTLQVIKHPLNIDNNIVFMIDIDINIMV
jgi:hypothetical protein